MGKISGSVGVVRRVQRITRNLPEPLRSESEFRLQYWLKRGRKLLDDHRSGGSELRAASIGVQSVDKKMSGELEQRAKEAIGKFNQKNKL
tara:strand:- start:159 stop:428 length:270 start_codon:yes stop_codon:yes gene_type:complete